MSNKSACKGPPGSLAQTMAPLGVVRNPLVLSHIDEVNQVNLCRNCRETRIGYEEVPARRQSRAAPPNQDFMQNVLSEKRFK